MPLFKHCVVRRRNYSAWRTSCSPDYRRVAAALGPDDARMQGGQFASAAKARSEFVAIPLSCEATVADMNDIAAALAKLAAASIPSDGARGTGAAGRPS